jgi:hypothetical protein
MILMLMVDIKGGVEEEPGEVRRKNKRGKDFFIKYLAKIVKSSCDALYSSYTRGTVLQTVVGTYDTLGGWTQTG